jgi:2-keto-3-deoxy-L-rhamnonate aldolase RhmA
MSTTSSSEAENLPLPVTPEQKFKAALHAGRRVYGTLVTSTSPRSIDAVAGVGIDCVFIDTEHIPLNWHDLGWMCRAYRGMGLVPIVRIPRADPYDACRVLDAGARGIVAAYVETADEVRALRGAVKLRPLKGKRLADVLSSERPLTGELARYVEQNNRDHVMLVNIESVAAIEALDSILAVPDLDGLLIGPHDLSCSLGIPEQYDHPQFEEAVHAIIARGRASGVGVGMHNLPKVEQDIKYAKAGLNLILRMSDLTLFRRGLMEDLARLKAGLGDTALAENSAHITI